MMLAQRHPHPRDSCISFEPGPHKYTITTREKEKDKHDDYVSVTTWNHSHFKEFDPDAVLAKMNLQNPKSKYFGQTPAQIKTGWEENRQSAAALGTTMHALIEAYYNEEGHTPLLTVRMQCKEMHLFQEFVQAHPHLEPYRSEWMIFHEEWRLAGAVDMVFRNTTDGTFHIYDWKRCKQIQKTNAFNECALTACIADYPDTNYWHYALQLNTYKAILEAKYGLHIADLCLVILHPDQERFIVQRLPILQSIHELLELRRKALTESI